MMRRLVAMTVLVLVLAACGGDDDDRPAQDSESAALERTVQAFSAAFLDGDAAGTAGYFTKRCVDLIGDQLPAVVAKAKDQYGDATMKSYGAEIDGTSATATYTFSDPAIDQAAERWLLVGGEWLNDDC